MVCLYRGFWNVSSLVSLQKFVSISLIPSFRVPKRIEKISSSPTQLRLGLNIFVLGLLRRANERSPLGVEDAGVAAAAEESVQGLGNPEDRQDREAESRPVNEGGRTLVIEDSEERPGDGNASGKIALRRREGVGGAGGLEGQERQEDEDLGEDTVVVTVGVHAECLKSGDEHEEDRESVPQGEGEVDEHFVISAVSGVILLDDQPDVRSKRADEESQDESDDEPSAA